MTIENHQENPPIEGIVCHPHPLHGGTMNNKVVTTTAHAFRELGAVSIRFNYRGVGKSPGEYGHGLAKQKIQSR